MTATDQTAAAARQSELAEAQESLPDLGQLDLRLYALQAAVERLEAQTTRILEVTDTLAPHLPLLEQIGRGGGLLGALRRGPT